MLKVSCETEVYSKMAVTREFPRTRFLSCFIYLILLNAEFIEHRTRISAQVMGKVNVIEKNENNLIKHTFSASFLSSFPLQSVCLTTGLLGPSRN